MFRKNSLIYILLLFISVGCENNSISYKPKFIPIKFTIYKSGKITISDSLTIATFVGEFSIDADYILKDEENSFLVIFRNRRTGFDKIYRIKRYDENIIAVLDGKTILTISNRQILIDITSGAIRNIIIKRNDKKIIKQKSTGIIRYIKPVYKFFVTAIKFFIPGKDTWDFYFKKKK